MDYYKEKQFIAQVDKNDKIIGKVEKWEAHKKAVLHRAFTMILYFQDKIVIQHRRHPVFDGYFDLSFSSHQIFINDTLEDDLTAIYKTLKREWNLEKSGLTAVPKKIGQIYYKAKDPQSVFYDHEIDYIYEGTLKNLPTPNYDFAYGYRLVNLLEIRNWKLEIKMAPWVKVLLEEKLI
ncbi:hypothetical protein A2767_05525 [Candidatus Roizmanbacteria bacterium RIFCSPHIGHO2_01_FULL_35_10]|uniref:Nudix hydrolase domain-containing protein n=1 Tax=Candidatus Roizmanbacteria bacterium RIFCSPLOWO2_01_FULL_35_13 TaxID=1802055 RepID=A0A1F7IBL5_9BACT|nr:MAG: hypothetical protein A2767_05525 [Candidatus Roizmanbacteria bacterium RIFCSPHIGHO2_01_FULL_35_10]OGK40752.1 MAG: hypothetical protein A3A74_03995 [Candidatus Roizmanbacteria bacterium RIFCSPLOWO2_01_FULL_35_13]